MKHYYENPTFFNLIEKIGAKKLMNQADIQEVKHRNSTTLIITPKTNSSLKQKTSD